MRSDEMEKKVKLFGSNNDRQICADRRRLHRHAHGRKSRNFSRSSTFSRRSSHPHIEPLDNVSDPKLLKKAIRMRRTKTHPELLNRHNSALERTPWLNLETPPLFTTMAANNNDGRAKFLVNVTIAQSTGALRVLVSIDATVVDVIKTALAQYCKEGRRPILSSDPLSFGLHHSQFTIQCLEAKYKIKDAGSRNFFLWPKKTSSMSIGSCGTDTVKISKITEPWEKLIDCLCSLL